MAAAGVALSHIALFRAAMQAASAQPTEVAGVSMSQNVTKGVKAAVANVEPTEAAVLAMK